MKKQIIILFIIATVLAAGIIFLPPLSIFVADKISPPIPIVEVEKPISISISAVGDVMVHKPQYEAAFDEESGLYSFDENFSFIAPYIQSADLALCNLETVFAGGKPVGYPAFNSPDSLAASLKKSGFDVALLSNNHILDRGTDGMIRTIEILNSSGIRTTGVRLEEEKPYLIMNIKGIKIGIISYTYETPKVNGRKTLNSNIVSEVALPLINTFNYEDLDLDITKIKENINLAKAEGAEVIICYFHWGEEYKLAPNEYQIKIAKSIAEAGTDIIFASHPHVLQPATIIVNEVTGKSTAVFYSMGNFISNQRTETLDNRYTEEGIIAKVNMDFMKSTKRITNLKVSAVPIWVDKYKLKSTKYVVIPLDKNISDNPAIAESGHLKRAQVALDDIIKIVGESFVQVQKEEIE